MVQPFFLICFSNTDSSFRSFEAVQQTLYVRYHTAVVCPEAAKQPPKKNVHNYNNHEEHEYVRSNFVVVVAQE